VGGGSNLSWISPNGQIVVFTSWAFTLVQFDRNYVQDVFVRDLRRDMNERLSVSSQGEEGNRRSCCPHASRNGRFVAFVSAASNLVPRDRNRVTDVFVYDRQRKRIERVSVTSSGRETRRDASAAYMSGNGRFVAFTTAGALVPGDSNGVLDAFLHDRLTGRTDRVSVGPDGQGSAASHPGAVSDDGRFVAFVSYASNLVPGDTNRNPDTFLRDRKRGRTERVNVRPDGGQSRGNANRPTMSADARFIAFRSWADDLVPNDRNNQVDAFVRDRLAARTKRVSVSSSGREGFGVTSRPVLSATGRWVVFTSRSSTLVPGDTNGRADIFRHDRLTGRTIRVSISVTGRQANGDSTRPTVSATGAIVAFNSFASNLVPRDTNRAKDVFVHFPRRG
jgi:Tol biopolymer transport system component